MSCAPKFQSSPCPKTECDPGPESQRGRLGRFQSSPCPKTECDRCFGTTKGLDVRFQSSPCPKTECDLTNVSPGGEAQMFQILTLPEDRVRPRRARAAGAGTDCFNPHPARRQSATAQCFSGGWGHPMGFNPHPARRQSATEDETTPKLRGAAFQSSPCPKTECDLTNVSPGGEAQMFQSSPCPKTECDVQVRAAPVRLHRVSILTLPEDRVRRDYAGPLSIGEVFQSSPCPKTECDSTSTSICPSGKEQFQSSPCPKTECDLRFRYNNSITIRDAFQSSPCPKTECDLRAGAEPGSQPGFNPHPARRQSATGRRRRAQRRQPVSILTLPEDRVRRC